MAKGKKGGKKAKKNASNVFSMFEPSQIQEFKEAFGMIDANQDGFIDKGRIYLDLSEYPRYFFDYYRVLPCILKIR